MVKREIFDEIITKMQKMAERYQNDALRKAVDEILNVRDHFELKVLLVGHFSSGKSTLINCLIGREGFLEVDQSETTCLATELRYGEKEEAFAYNKQLEREHLVAGKEYLPDEYDHLSYQLNAEALKKIEDFVIVDTPGYDTMLEAHSIALNRYLKYGVGFLVIIDLERGGIDSNTLAYLQEISHYSRNIAILFNKRDKYLEENIQKVLEGAKVTLGAAGLDFPVESISKYDPDVQDKLCRMILKIDAQETFRSILQSSIRTNARYAAQIIHAAASDQYLNTYEYDEVIRIQNRNKQMLRKSFEKKKKELMDGLDESVEIAIQAVKSALYAVEDAAASAIENGNQDGLRAVIVDAIRPVLVREIKNFSVERIREISNSLSIEIEQNLKGERGLDDIVLGVGDKLQNLFDTGRFVGEQEEENNQGQRGAKNTNDIYKMITGALAITMDAINPAMEIVIILLPEIVAGLKYLFGESNHSKIVKRFENEIIPKVTETLWPTIRESYEENVAKMIELYEQELEESMLSVTKLLEEIQAKKREDEENFEAIKKQMQVDMEELKSIAEG